jgi:hypothetical protein
MCSVLSDPLCSMLPVGLPSSLWRPSARQMLCARIAQSSGLLPDRLLKIKTSSRPFSVHRACIFWAPGRYASSSSCVDGGWTPLHSCWPRTLCLQVAVAGNNLRTGLPLHPYPRAQGFSCHLKHQACGSIKHVGCWEVVDWTSVGNNFWKRRSPFCTRLHPFKCYVE